jgi:hypothetical protein
MSRRFAKFRGRVATAAVLGAAGAGSALLLTACLTGDGGDALTAALDATAGDAQASDAPAGDAASDAAKAEASSEAASDGGVSDATVAEAGDAGPSGPPVAVFSSTSVDFGPVGCGGPAATKTINVNNSGGGALAVSASLVGSAFTVSPTTLSIPKGGSGQLVLTATVPGSASAGVPLSGSLAIFTNDPGNASRVFPLQVTPSGGSITGLSQYAFPSSEIGTPSAPVTIALKNDGNAQVVLAFDAPSDSHVTVGSIPAGGVQGITLNAGDTWTANAFFTPTGPAAVTGSSTISTTSGNTCGSTLSKISFSGQGAMGVITGWPSTNAIDFGPANCGGAAPADQTIVLSNVGTTDAKIVAVDTTVINGFSTDATVGTRLAAGGAPVTITIHAPAVPSPSPMTPISGTLVLATDADNAPHTITLTEEPQGASLAFVTQGTANFGSFPSVILLQSSSQPFSVANSGNVAANVTLTAVENGADAGSPVDPPDGAVDADVDGAADAGPPPPTAFALSVPSFALAAGGTQADTITFQPVHANTTVGQLSMTVDPRTPLCSILPAPLPLSGSAIGAGPVVSSTALSFGAACGGAAPDPQSVTISNDGTVDMNWTLSTITGPGASQYKVRASPAPGLLAPGASATVTVSALSVPSPAPSLDPSTLAAQFTIGTDVPFDPPHVVSLSEIPLGDQLSLSVGNLRFGQIPVGTTIGQSFGVTNSANPGSPDANVTLTMASTLDGGGVPYSLSSSTLSGMGPGTTSETLTFAPQSAGPDPITITVSVPGTEALCTPLPSPITVTGTGTAGSVSLSASSFAFGTDPSDPLGLVNCGATGLPRTLTISNVGNQPYNIVSVTLQKGAQSPFTLSGPATTVPANLLISGQTSLTITPSAIPQNVANPEDASAFSDVLVITTDAANDSPHSIPLTMQPRGAIITAATPLPTNWSFGTVGPGSIGTFTTAIQNTGNAPANVALTNLTMPSIFGLKDNPTVAAGQAITSLVGQFTPPSASGNWSDVGQLSVTTDYAFCAPLPTQWMTPAISLSGQSNASPVVSLTGNLVFPATDCGSSAPGGQSVTLTNGTNQAFTYTVKLGTGTWYTLSDPNGGTLAANGTATIVVNPIAVIPGPGVRPGSAPYADDLVIAVATSPDTDTNFTVPISWTLNGAVLSLPQGPGPSAVNGSPTYIADSVSGLPLGMTNSGTASVTVSMALQPPGAFALQPAGSLQVLPNVPTSPELVSTLSSPACPTTVAGTVTFTYTGPVCQPFAYSTVNVNSCAGTY